MIMRENRDGAGRQASWSYKQWRNRFSQWIGSEAMEKQNRKVLEHDLEVCRKVSSFGRTQLVGMHEMVCQS